MFVGVARIVIQIPGARSLKDRRRVVKSVKDRVRARSAAAVAEVGDLERYQVATLGLAVVSNDTRHCSELLSQATSLVAGHGEAVVADVATELVPFGSGGRGVRGGIESRLGSELGDWGDDQADDGGADDDDADDDAHGEGDE